MDRFSRRVYSAFYLRMLDMQVQQRKKYWERWRRLPEEPGLRTIRQFDARYTAPLNGFRNTDDYYSQSSAVDLLKYIEVPTWILADQHDPIVTAKSFAEAQYSPSTQLTVSRYGGHMGYFGLDEHGQLIRWMEYFVKQHLKQQAD